MAWGTYEMGNIDTCVAMKKAFEAGKHYRGYRSDI
jgi:hypothetical protein